MHFVIVNIQVKGYMVDAFIQETVRNVQGSLQEQEVISFDF
jgi:quinol monooxygenase YgiN